jgi:ADP-ribosyl-[dinitrogen reductase] hydrolase
MSYIKFDKLKRLNADAKTVFEFVLNPKKIPNVMLGTAISDALGMPFEGLSCDNKALTDWDGKSYLPSRHRDPTFYGSSLNVGKGCFTDDTQLSCVIAQSLIENKKFNPDDLSKRYIDWIYGGEARGFGGTTKRAIDNLKGGTHWSKSGVEGSYGNGTAMRAAPFGAFYANKDYNDMFHAVKIDSAITHRSVEAEAGALAIAITTYLNISKSATGLPQSAEHPDVVIEYLSVHLPSSKVKEQILKAHDMATSKLRDTLKPSVALRMLGTGCDVRQTVPAAMYCYWRFNKFEDAVVAAIRAGSDADTTGAIVGAMFGAKTKLGDIPFNWVKGVENYKLLRELDDKLVA